MAYAHLRSVTVHYEKVGSDLTDYPVCINGVYSYLATVANGGAIVNTVSVGGITVPADLIFTTETFPAGTTVLPFEIESYDAVTGAIVAWVRVPAVSSSVDTVFFFRYGDAAVTTWQGDVNGTWRSEFKGVWHLQGPENGATVPPSDPLFPLTDSTVNANNGTPSGLGNISSQAGQVDGSARWSGGGDGITVTPTSSLQLQRFTVSFWVDSFEIGEFGSSHGLVTEITLSGGGAAITSGWAIIQFRDGTLRWEYSSGSAQASSFTLSIDTWYFITISFDATSGELKIYKNAVLVDTVAAVATPLVYAGDTPTLGGPNTGGLGDNVFTAHHGRLDEIRIYSGIQSVGWILTEYNNEFSPSTFYTIGPESTPFTASCGNPPDGVAGEFYTHTFPTPTDGGIPPFFYALLTRDDESFTPEDVLNNITLSPFTAIWSGYPAVPGTYQFTLDVVDTVSYEAKVDCEITITDGAATDPPDWRPVPPVDTPGPGAGWDFSGACARTGSSGLRHIADGSDLVANSKAASLTPITVEAGWTLYVAFWLKGSGGADGTVGFGFMFYDTNGVYLSEEYATSTGSPTTWTQFNGNITVPADAVTAVPVIQTIEHRTGTWCIDDVYAIRSGGHFILSSVKAYFDPYTLYR